MFNRIAARLPLLLSIAGLLIAWPVRAQIETADAIADSESELDSTERRGWYMGRQIAPTMSADGAEWLTRKSREREEAPHKLLRALQIRPGQHVCDFGCGNGYYTFQLALRVGPRGKIYAVDIQQRMLDLLRERAASRNIDNIAPVLATEIDPKLPTDKLDLVLMVDVYHELSQPAEVLAAVNKSLRANGRVVLVEFREEDPDVPIRALHKMSQSQVIKEIAASGFKLVGQFDELPWQHVLLFAREDSALPQVKLVPWRPAVSVLSVVPQGSLPQADSQTGD